MTTMTVSGARGSERRKKRADQAMGGSDGVAPVKRGGPPTNSVMEKLP